MTQEKALRRIRLLAIPQYNEYARSLPTQQSDRYPTVAHYLNELEVKGPTETLLKAYTQLFERYARKLHEQAKKDGLTSIEMLRRFGYGFAHHLGWEVTFLKTKYGKMIVAPTTPVAPDAICMSWEEFMEVLLVPQIMKEKYEVRNTVLTNVESGF